MAGLASAFKTSTLIEEAKAIALEDPPADPDGDRAASQVATAGRLSVMLPLGAAAAAEAAPSACRQPIGDENDIARARKAPARLEKRL
jgi:hypothetical protein